MAITASSKTVRLLFVIFRSNGSVVENEGFILIGTCYKAEGIALLLKPFLAHVISDILCQLTLDHVCLLYGSLLTC